MKCVRARAFRPAPLIFCVLLRRRWLNDCANSPENRLGQAQPASAMLAKLENLPTARGENRRGRNPVEEWKRFAALRGKFGKERETGAMAENTKDSFLMTLEGGEGEIVEKKSRFIATVRPVASEEEALAFIEEMKKKYWDARHNCSAFAIGRNQELMRFSDDGEPQGTAGKPMLDVLLGAGLHNTAVVVTRYFGGTLLGTGGLVRAYSGAVQEGLRHAVTAEQCYGIRLSIETDYNGIGKIQYILGQRGIATLSSEYTDKVMLEVLVPAAQQGELTAALTEGTNGRAVLTPGDPCWYLMVDGELLPDRIMPT